MDEVVVEVEAEDVEEAAEEDKVEIILTKFVHMNAVSFLTTRVTEFTTSIISHSFFVFLPVSSVLCNVYLHIVNK